MALAGKTAEERIYRFFKTKKLSDYGIFGLMGNLYAESNLNSRNLQNSYEQKLGFTDASYTSAVDSGRYTNFVYDSAGYGLAQWTYWNRKQGLYNYAKAQHKSIGDEEMQCDYLYTELATSYPSVLSVLQSATSIRQASDVVLTQFERPADQSESVKQRRASYGQDLYNKVSRGGGLKNPLTEFIAEAKKHIGEGGSWSWKMNGKDTGYDWCGAFVNAVAIAVGLKDKLFKSSTARGAGNIPRDGVAAGLGTWLKGPYQGGNPIPQIGDMILFRTVQEYRRDTYHSDHVGIVVDYKNSRVYTVEGNTAGNGSNWARTSKVSAYNYGVHSTCINGFYRPHWERIGGFATGSGIYTLAPLYDTESTRADGILREVAYTDTKSEPSIKPSGIKLSAINYTSVLAAAFGVLAGQYNASLATSLSGGGGTADISRLSSVPKGIVQYFMDKGFSAAVGVGVAANIREEIGSNWNIGASGVDSNGYMSGGLIMWNDGWGGFTKMKNYVGSNWKTNLTGQLDFLWYHITNMDAGTIRARMKKYYHEDISLTDYMRKVPNTEAGARAMADRFVYCVEQPGNIAYQSKKRQGNASELWKSVIPMLSTNISPK